MKRSLIDITDLNTDELDELISACVALVSENYQLEVTSFKKECFGMG